MTTTDFDLTHSSSLCNGKDLNGHAVLQQEKYRLQNPSAAYRRHAIALAVGWLPMLAAAQPLGGQVVSGSASISQSGAPGQSVTTVKQNSPVTSIHWKSFNLGTGDTVNFVQPSTQAVAINRISDVAGSKIHGRIQANGQVWLLNPNGILFGKDAQINVGGLLASTLTSNAATAKHSITGSVWNSQANTSPGNLPAGMKSAQTGIALVDKSDAATVSAKGLDSQQMMKSSNFSAWNKDSTWIMYDTNARPLLRAFMTPLYLKSKADDFLVAEQRGRAPQNRLA
jgi:filamentous hemagglutinin family protein